MALPTTAPRRIPATGKIEVQLVKATGKPAMMAVYDESGQLAGWIDPAKLQPVAPAPGSTDEPSSAQVDAQAAKVKAQHASPNPATQQQANTTAEVQKQMASLLHAVPPQKRKPGEIRKAAGSTLGAQYEVLLKTVSGAQADAIKRTVAVNALSLMIAGAATDKTAVTLCKRAAVQYAVNKDLI